MLASCQSTMDEQINPPTNAHGNASLVQAQKQPIIERRKIEEGLAAGLEYLWVTPVGINERTPLVIVSHGFMRDSRRMRGLATHLASRGYAVACPDLRHSRPWSGGHAANAADIAALAEAIGPGRKVAFVGFSAGAYSSLLATATFRPAALVLLDPVFAGDKDDLADSYAGPVLAILARAGSCNAMGSARGAVEALPGVRLIDLPDASHAHFEFPIDPLARRLCGGALGESSDESLQARILEEAAGFLLREMPPSAR